MLAHILPGTDSKVRIQFEVDASVWPKGTGADPASLISALAQIENFSAEAPANQAQADELSAYKSAHAAIKAAVEGLVTLVEVVQ
jgi:hypothetical protein